ncbi:15879_t:CDS:2 [Entrophospora sp. SA101]|nr:11446_t:CDS:2 [Entrophospora sp. SA101]CAJ0758757.1 15879_t:CDS:2 [Entrophospora sp. SA101]CAJ0825102.1 8302_t:CDS:2 [Entrophospora sp. SA101]CAJ0841782.1 4071_t:CDS:2 [Entrophospora sp. SA101]
MAISQVDTKIIFKSNDSHEEFFVFGNPDLVLKWRKDQTIPLVDVVQSFDVYETVNGGNQGIAGRPSKQRLENTFGTSDTTQVITHILQHGNVHNSHKSTAINETRGKGISTSESATGVHN